MLQEELLLLKVVENCKVESNDVVGVGEQKSREVGRREIGRKIA